MQQKLSDGGWLKDARRRARRDHPNTLTTKDVLGLINTIENTEFYLSETIATNCPDLNVLLKMRDKALLSLIWIFFKRAKEILGLKRSDVTYGILPLRKIIQGKRVTKRVKCLQVTFNIAKKQKRTKRCPMCRKRNAFESQICKHCFNDIKDVPISMVGKPKRITKNITTEHKCVKYVSEWVEKLDELVKDNDDIWLFPAFRTIFSSGGYFDYCAEKHMTVRQLDYILARLDPTMTSCMFRYGGAERLVKLGYSLPAIQKRGDWSSIAMPAIYAERKGISEEEVEMIEDVG